MAGLARTRMHSRGFSMGVLLVNSVVMTVTAGTPVQGTYLVCNGVPLTHTDSVRIEFPAGSFVLSVNMYDGDGNLRGTCFTNWSRTGTLHSLVDSLHVSRLDYRAFDATSDETGWIIARPVDTAVVLPVDRILVKVKVHSGVAHRDGAVRRPQETGNGASPKKGFELNGRKATGTPARGGRARGDGVP